MMNQAWLLGLGASVGALWGQARNFFMQFVYLFIVEVKVDQYTATVLREHLTKHHKSSPNNVRRFHNMYLFIKPKKKYGHVLFETFHYTNMFFMGWKPIWIQGETSGGGQGSLSNNGTQTESSNSDKSVRFLRFSIDVENLLLSAFDQRNEVDWAALDVDMDHRPSRFQVRRLFGQHISHDNSGNKAIAGSSMGSDHSSSSTITQFEYSKNRFLRYSFDDLNPEAAKSSFEKLVYDEDIQKVADMIRHWHSSRDFFDETGLNWRLGIGLNGGPGTGKSSFTRAIAHELDLPIYIIDLTSMSNEELVQAWNTAKANIPAIVLFEDFDRLFTEKNEFKPSMQTNFSGKPNLTLDALLNCISGVENGDGILTIVTTNDINKLDEAIGRPTGDGNTTRAGRLDFIVTFKNLTHRGRLKIARRIFKRFPEYVDEYVQQYQNVSGAEFEKVCGVKAVELFWESKQAEMRNK